MPMQKKAIALAVSALFVAGCASKKVSLEEPEKMDRTLNANTGQRGEKVGVRDDKVIVQKKIYLEEELRKLQDDIEDLENNIYGKTRKDPGGLWLKLQECRKQLSDPRVGGSSVPEPMEVWEKISENDPDYNYRVDDKNNVVAVSEEELDSRISNLKKTKRVLDRRFADYKEKADSCEHKYHAALIQHGLNPEDTAAKGEWVEGPDGNRVWKMRRPASKDPEELMRRKQQRDKKQAASPTDE